MMKNILVIGGVMMKILSFTIIFITYLTAYSQVTFLENINQNDSLIKANSIKKMIAYSIEENDTLLSFMEYYDSNGRLIKHIEYEVKGTDAIIHSKFIYQYKYGQGLSKVLKYNNEDSLEFEESFNYNSKNQLTKYKISEKNSSEMSLSYQYNELGNLITKKSYIDNTIMSTWKYVYNDSNQLHEIYMNDTLIERYEYGEATEYGEKIRQDKIISYDKEGKIKDEYYTSYNDNGTKIQEKQFFKPNNKQHHWTYQYNEKRDLISINCYLGYSFHEEYTYYKNQLLKEHKIIFDDVSNNSYHFYKYFKN